MDTNPCDDDTIQENERKKPFMCSVCEKSFRFQSHVKQHFESVHEGKRHKCSLCGSNFSREGTLKRHISTLHNENKENQNNYHIVSIHDGKKHKRNYVQNELAHEKKNQKNRSAFRCEVCDLSVAPKKIINHLKTAHT